MTGRSPFRWRQLRWLGLAVALPVLWACNARRLETPNSAPVRNTNNVFQETVNRDIDILFMVDNSLSMQPLIAKLTQNFPAFMQVLEQPPGLPNVHIAVVSSDMGAGQWSGIPQCAIGGDGGSFHFDVGAGTTEPGGMICTTTGLQANQHFISNINGNANYDTTIGIEKVFGCIASLGDKGCGFEHQLQSVVRALNADGQGLPANNTDFLRKQAYLAIILLTNEDDCSAPPDTDLFDTNSKSIADPFGPLQSYRCNEFGHLCNGAPPPRTMAAQFSMPPGQCVSAEGMGNSRLIPVDTIIGEIKSLKSDPSQILVAAIAGPPDPYNVVMVDATAGTSDASAGIKWPNVDHSCVQNSGEYADPAVRLKRFVDGFGGNGLFLPICAPTLVTALTTIGQTINKVLGAKCVVGQLLDKNGMPTDGPGADCSVVDHQFTNNTETDTIIPPCPAGPKCWDLVNDAMCTPGADGTPSHLLRFTPPPDPTVSGLNATISCSIKVN
jgi:hypothetical protein